MSSDFTKRLSPTDSPWPMEDFAHTVLHNSRPLLNACYLPCSRTDHSDPRFVKPSSFGMYPIQLAYNIAHKMAKSQQPVPLPLQRVSMGRSVLHRVCYM